MKNLVVLLFMIVQGNSVFAEMQEGKVTTVLDGNTLEIIDQNKEIQRVQLTGIDCPELNQEYGDQAKLFLEKLVLNKKITFQITGKDRLGNRQGIVLINGSRDIRMELLKEGLAWTAERNSDPELEPLRQTAADSRKGLWSQENPIAPWIFRRQQTMLGPKES